MSRFQKIIFWCEFPERVDWKRFHTLLAFPTEVYVACHSRKEYTVWKRKVERKGVVCGAWPVLPKEEGYWFSGYCSRKSIAKLLEFEGIPMKIDVEPPFPTIRYSFFNLLFYYAKLFLSQRAQNKEYLHEVVARLVQEGRVIVSGIPLPWVFRKRYGDDIDVRALPGAQRNFFFYTTLHPRWLDFVMRMYYSLFIYRDLRVYRERMLCAVGCIGHGVFGVEPVFSSVRALERDLQWLLRAGVQNLVVFDVAGIMNRKDAGVWMDLLARYSAR